MSISSNFGGPEGRKIPGKESYLNYQASTDKNCISFL